jgi:hypothetical protein
MLAVQRAACRRISWHASSPSCRGKGSSSGRSAGLGDSPRTQLEEFALIRAHDAILPTHARGEIGWRYVTQPDAAQAALLDCLGMVPRKPIRLQEIAAHTPERNGLNKS